MGIHRQGPPNAALVVCQAAVRKDITPGIGAAICAAPSFFPFGFGGQSTANPSAVRCGVLVADMHNRVILPAIQAAALSLGGLPIDAVHFFRSDIE